MRHTMETHAIPRAEEPVRRTVLRPGPSLPGHTLLQDEAQTTWIIDGALIACTPPEFVCLSKLLERANQCVPFAQLAGDAPTRGAEETAAEKEKAVRRVRYRMSRLRPKLWSVGIDIVNVRSVGYLLVLETPVAENRTSV